MKNNKKPSLFYILNVLEEFTDTEHFLTQKELIDKISIIYGETYDRKTISSSIDTLIELGYDIIKNPKGGNALISRKIEKIEAQFLTDAIYSSKCISDAQSKELSSKVLSLLSKYERKSFTNLYKSSNAKVENKELFLNLEIITDSIDLGSKVSFQYTTFNAEGKKTLKYGGMNYKVSPFYIVNNFGKYYLICKYDKYDGMGVYRIDHMTNVTMLQEDSCSEKEVLGENFDITKFLNENIYIFGGKPILAKFKILDKNAIDYVVDWFGKNANIYHIEDDLIVTATVNENAFYYWAMQYGEYIEVVEPVEVRDRIKNTLTKLLERYN